MDLTHLRYFQAIASSGSMTAAAKQLRVSQPTLTVAIKNLEEELKTTLFLRSRSGVELTTTGDELLENVRLVFAQLDRAQQRILGLETEEAGSFVIGCHESLGAYFLPGFMTEFLKAAPGIEISLWSGPSAEALDAVVGRDVHFGIIVNPRPHPDLVIVDLFKDAVDFIVAADEPGTDALDAAEARLRAGPLVFAGRVAQCQELIHRLGADHLLPTRMLSCGDLELVKSLTAAGVGVGLLPRRVAAYGLPGRLRRLHPSLPWIPDTICLVYRADFHRTRACLRLKDALVAHGKALAPDPLS
jgi:DNA-binding transcriptional LysR family regulator